MKRVISGLSAYDLRVSICDYKANSIFSWLPNFSLRIIRTTAVPVTEESINSGKGNLN